MHGDLGARLLLAGLVSRAELARALRDGGGTGSTLAAALVANGLSEDALARFFLTEGYAPLLRSPDLAAPPAEALAAIDGVLAHALFVVPLAVTPTSMRLAMIDPSDAHAREEVAFVTGRTVEAALARVGDLRRALEQAYGAAPEPVVLLSKPRTSSAIPLVRPKAAPSPAKPEPAPTPAEAAPMPASSSNQRSASPTEPRGTDAADDTSWASLPPPTAPSPKREGRVRARTVLGIGAMAMGREAGGVANAAPSIAPDLGLENVRDAPRRRYARPRRGDEAPDVGPWLASLRAATDRDHAVRLACEASAELGRAAVFLVLRRGVLRGWDAVGPDVSREAVANLWIPASSASIFRDVIAEGRVFLGPVGTSAADQVYRAAIGSRGGRTGVYPIVVAGKATAILSVDEIGFADVGPARLGSIADAAGSALERLLVDTKSRTET